ncbi:tyrosine-type recombinase/integrase [Nocardia sp. NBC_01329]|uniref:tyrosine-type recombinase/integrase n=1 Tax=Nocardia sp. NBC_01329 TaxID=2903594 RepID=UPI002E0DBAA4|nr:tyrosine-type recombinase/integrase [Nocardia sp. NBC_01329]
MVGLPDEFVFHELRHYLASLSIANGADIKVVQARMRHATAKTTLGTYGHLWPDADESTRRVIASVITERVDSKPSTAYRGPKTGVNPQFRLTRRSRVRTRTGAAADSPGRSPARA